MAIKTNKEDLEVSHASLQSAIVIPGIFTTETTLSQQRIPGIKMWKSADSLIINVKNTWGFVPLTNVKSGVFVNSQDKD